MAKRSSGLGQAGSGAARRAPARSSWRPASSAPPLGPASAGLDGRAAAASAALLCELLRGGAGGQQPPCPSSARLPPAAGPAPVQESWHLSASVSAKDAQPSGTARCPSHLINSDSSRDQGRCARHLLSQYLPRKPEGMAPIAPQRREGRCPPWLALLASWDLDRVGATSPPQPAARGAAPLRPPLRQGLAGDARRRLGAPPDPQRDGAPQSRGQARHSRRGCGSRRCSRRRCPAATRWAPWPPSAWSSCSAAPGAPGPRRDGAWADRA